MDEKRADDRRIINRNEISLIEDEISKERKDLNKIEEVESEFIKIKKGIDRLVSLLSESIKGGNINQVFDSIENDSGKVVSSALGSIGESRDNIKNKIKALNDRKDELTENN